MPTYSLGWCAEARTPASPTMPMAIPAARPLRPHARPPDRCAKPWKSEYDGLAPSEGVTARPSERRARWRRGRGTRCARSCECAGAWCGPRCQGHTARALRAPPALLARLLSGGAARTAVANDDSNDEAVDTEHSRHDNRDDALHDQIRLQHTHGRDADTTLRSPVRSAKVCAIGRMMQAGARSSGIARTWHGVCAPSKRRRGRVLAKMSAAAAPMKPKNGADGGQSGSSSGMMSAAAGGCHLSSFGELRRDRGVLGAWAEARCPARAHLGPGARPFSSKSPADRPWTHPCPKGGRVRPSQPSLKWVAVRRLEPRSRLPSDRTSDWESLG